MGGMIFDLVPLELYLNITFNIFPISDRHIGVRNKHPFKTVHF